MKPNNPLLTTERAIFHQQLLAGVLHLDADGVPSNADKHSRASCEIARGIAKKMGETTCHVRQAGQTSGSRFENICRDYLKATFCRLTHLRPGRWQVKCVGNNRKELTGYEQYSHLAALHAAAATNPELAASLGNDYLIAPDIIICREPESDDVLNQPCPIVDHDTAVRASLRGRFNPFPILHASISCKWSLRSDRAQNARSEALNLIRNRKGRLPHVVAILAEPLPARIASIALGTGDIDCVYHVALPEMLQAVTELNDATSLELMAIMVDGKRLRDIADLPLDLAV